MNTDERSKLNLLSSAIIGAAHAVSNELGCGFLEKVYENALVVELRARGLEVQQQAGRYVRYRNEIVGEYFADLVVEGKVIVELKTVSRLNTIHEAQCLNYLRATGLPLCLLIDFAKPRLVVQRVIHAMA
jgi:GxxExxY protein